MDTTTSDLYRHVLSQQTDAALGSLTAALRSPLPIDPWTAASLLERLGDALRLDQPMGHLSRALASRLPLELLATVVRDRAEEAGSWTVSADDDDRNLFPLCRRDETESLLIGLTRVLLARGEIPADVAGFDGLCDALSDYDRAITNAVGRRRAIAALGVRAVLQSDA